MQNILQRFLILFFCICSIPLFNNLYSSETPFHPEEFNIAPYCRIGSTPYAGFSLNILVDGYAGKESTDIFGHIEFGNKINFNTRTNQTDMRLGAIVYMTLPSPSILKRVRIYRGEPGITYTVDADTSGDDNFNVHLGTINDKGTGWSVLEVGEIKVHKVRISAEGGNSPVYFGLEEVELWVSGKNPDIKKISLPVLHYGKLMGWDEIDLTLEPGKDNLQRVLYIWGPGIYSNPEFWAQKTAELEANAIILYTHMPGNIASYEDGDYTVPEDPVVKRYLERGLQMLKERGKTDIPIASWPSKSVPGTRIDHLKKTIDAFHRYGIKVIASPSFHIPFDTAKHYPRGGQSDWHNLPSTPCLISDEFVFNLGLSIYKELLERGVDGIVLGGDEFRAEGHRLAFINPYDPCILKFSQKYGYEPSLASLPLGAEDTLRYRQWKIFEYEGIAQLFRKWTDELRKIKKDIITANLFLPDFGVYSERMWSNLAFDIIGYQSGMDYLCTDYYRPLTTIKFLSASHPHRKAGYTWTIGRFRPAYIPFEHPVDTYGPVFSILGQSGKELSSIELYEHRHIFRTYSNKTEWDDERDRGYETVKNTFRTIKYLQKEGITEAESPKRIALLHSRSSEDWWQLKNGYRESVSPTIMRQQWGEEWRSVFTKNISPERNKQNLQQMEGYIWFQAIMDLLTSRGYPYDVYPADRPESLDALMKYDVVIIPFGYSISREAMEKIRKAVNGGTSFIIINRLGEVDEWGIPYEIPAFKEILSRDNVSFLEIDIKGKGEKDLGEKILPLIDRYVRRPLPRFHLTDEKLYGKVFAFFLENSKRYFITLVNFSTKDAGIEIKLPITGRKMKQVSLQGVRPVIILSPFSKINYVIPAGEGVVLIVDCF